MQFECPAVITCAVCRTATTTTAAKFLVTREGTMGVDLTKPEGGWGRRPGTPPTIVGPRGPAPTPLHEYLCPGCNVKPAPKLVST